MAKIQKAKEKDKEPKICPILMAGLSPRMGIEIFSDSPACKLVLCLGDKCEWFNNGCPAHPGKIFLIP